MNYQKGINSQVGWSIFASVIMIFAGMLAIIVPTVSGIAATLSIGSLLAVAGIAHFVFALHLRVGEGKWWGILFGILCAGIGSYMFMHPYLGLASLTLALAAWIFMQAILEFLFAYYLRPLPGVGWMVFDGILMIILGTLICLTWPANTDMVIGILVGVGLVSSGVTRFIPSLYARSVAKAFFPKERPTLEGTF